MFMSVLISPVVSGQIRTKCVAGNSESVFSLSSRHWQCRPRASQARLPYRPVPGPPSSLPPCCQQPPLSLLCRCQTPASVSFTTALSTSLPTPHPLFLSNFVFETNSHCVAQSGLKLYLIFPCLCLPNAGVTGVSHHAYLL